MFHLNNLLSIIFAKLRGHDKDSDQVMTNSTYIKSKRALLKIIPKKDTTDVCIQMSRTGKHTIPNCLLLGSRAKQKQVIHTYIRTTRMNTYILPKRLGDLNLEHDVLKQYLFEHKHLFIIPDISYVSLSGQRWLKNLIVTGKVDVSKTFQPYLKGAHFFIMSSYQNHDVLQRAEHQVGAPAEQYYLEHALLQCATIWRPLDIAICSYIIC